MKRRERVALVFAVILDIAGFALYLNRTPGEPQAFQARPIVETAHAAGDRTFTTAP